MELCAALGWLDRASFARVRQRPWRSSADSTAASTLRRCRRQTRRASQASRCASDLRSARARIRCSRGVSRARRPRLADRCSRRELALEGRCDLPSGGRHASWPRRTRAAASAISTIRCSRCAAWPSEGLTRILYVDLDAHHGDGVQDAVRDDPRIHTISIHESGRWPFTGAADDRGGGRSRNYPVPAGFNDSRTRVPDGGSRAASGGARCDPKPWSLPAAPMRWREIRSPGSC